MNVFHYNKQSLNTHSQLKREVEQIALFYNRLGSTSSPKGCLYFQDFQDSKLLNGCLVVSPNKQILSVFQ